MHAPVEVNSMQSFDKNNTDLVTDKEQHYEAVRFNAMKHGILSKLVVLPHEDVQEFTTLLDDLMEEHQPVGKTEQHLVEELATIFWRKRRVLLAEGATINRTLWSIRQNANIINASVPLETGLSGQSHDLIDLLTATSDEMTERLQYAELDLAATQKAKAILRKGGKNAYQKARSVLMSDSRDWWDEYVEDEQYSATADGLAEFIRETLEPMCTRMVKEAGYQPAIKAQTLGEGLQAHRLEKLNRYEIHLDRKFERTLAMLLKLKELRNKCNLNSEK